VKGVGNAVSPVSLFIQGTLCPVRVRFVGVWLPLLRVTFTRQTGACLSAVSPWRSRATRKWQQHQALFSGRARCCTTSISEHNSMPGKHLPSATDEPCNKCEDNISVIVVRAKPLCQSVRLVVCVIACAKFQTATVLRYMSTQKSSSDWRVSA
jgi:hypothetical protein